jgi:F0F1-type ATP synthase, subunit a
MDQTDSAAPKKASPMKRAFLVGAALCLVVGLGLAVIFPHAEHEPLSVSLGAPPMTVLGVTMPSSVMFTWAIMLVLIVAAIVIRWVVIPRFSDHPGPLQNALETAVETAESFTASHVHGLGDALAPYVFTVAVYIVCSAMVELLGLRPPTTDITVTFALSLITFAMINYYGIKRNGIVGRAKQFMKPMAFMIPFKLLSDVAVPISLACRLFGNMLGGMIVMSLVYMALGHFSVGVPAVLGLYFNMFHPLIQVFIFIKLSLSFIEEAVEG